MSEVEVRLIFRGRDELVGGLPNVPGSHAWKAGDRVHRAATIVQETSGWSVGSGRPTSESLELQVASVTSVLHAHQHTLEVAASQCAVELSIAVYFEGDPPALTIGGAQMAWLGKLSASLDIALYPWLPDREAH